MAWVCELFTIDPSPAYLFLVWPDVCKDGNKRRIILDLSFPSHSGHSVNLSVNKNSHVRTPFSLRLPTFDTICQVLNIMGKNTKILKVDLARAFQQLHLDPFDVKYMGLRWGLLC
jgi:hypothetical protein